MKNIIFCVLILSSFLTRGQEVISDTLESRPAIPVDMSAYKKNSFKFSWGLRAGISKTRINTSSGDVLRVTPNGTPVVGENGIVRDELVSNTAFGNGYQGAIFGRFITGSFYIQPEVIYGLKGGKFDFLDKSGNLLNRVDAKFTAIDVPILLGLRVRDVRIFGGPSFSYALKKNKEFEKALSPYTNQNLSEDFFNRPILNGVIGLGIELKSFFFDLRYEGGIANYAETTLGPANNPMKFNFTTDQFILSIGFVK